MLKDTSRTITVYIHNLLWSFDVTFSLFDEGFRLLWASAVVGAIFSRCPAFSRRKQLPLAHTANWGVGSSENLGFYFGCCLTTQLHGFENSCGTNCP